MSRSMEHIDNEEQVSIAMDDHEVLLDYDSEANSSTSSSDRRFGFFTRNGMIRSVEEEGNNNSEYKIMEKSFLAGMGPMAKVSNVVAIHRNAFCNLTGKARLDTFRIFSEAVSKKCGGDANVKYGWYGASRNEISDILSHGFSRFREHENRELLGFGVHLSPANLSLDEALLSSEDEDGLRHMLLCRVILGNMEVIYGGSKQFQPSSKEFDSGVDNLSSPAKYIIWSAYMNSHILPCYIISFKSPCSTGLQRIQAPVLKPSSPYMKLPILLPMLSGFLPPPKMVLVTKYHSELRENKITRSQFVRRLRQIAGDKLLVSVIKFYRNKKHTARTRSSAAADA